MTELLKDGHNRIILDLEEVPTVGSSGIGILVRFFAREEQGGGAIRLLKPSKFTVQTLKMVGLLNLFSPSRIFRWRWPRFNSNDSKVLSLEFLLQFISLPLPYLLLVRFLFQAGAKFWPASSDVAKNFIIRST